MSRNINFTGDIEDLDENLFELDKLQRPGTSGAQGGGRPQTRQRPHTGSRGKKHDADDENLGEDFEETPWVPPSIEKATKFKRERIFRNGDARIDSVDIIHAPDVGAGVNLYFQFAMSMTICLFIMSVLSLPSLIFTYHGQGISPEDQDALGLFQYTLGNIGYDPTLSDYKTLAKCNSPRYTRNDTCLHISGNEVSINDAANVITAMEFLQILVFFIGVFHLYRKAISVSGKKSNAEASVSDYSIMVTNIPRDTTEEELLNHFNKLYGLDERDFKGRPPLEGAEPISDVGNSRDSRYEGKWIAECILHKGIGDFISSFKNKQHIMERMYRCRARMKMYAENSPHADGHNMSLYMKAEKQMIHTGAIIDKVTEQNMKRSGLKIISERDTEAIKRISNPRSIYYNIDADSVAGFIVFQYGESMARCVSDYTRYSSFPMSLFYPQELKFRGHKIKVVKAPEPDQIIWEHIEVTDAEKTYLRARTGIITISLVILCFIIILQASIYKALFAKNIPQLSLCTSVIPNIYTNGTQAADKLSLVRPGNSQISKMDSLCDIAIPGTFWAAYSNGTKLVAPYDVSGCDKTDLCPKTGDLPYCPCVSTSSRDQCKTCYKNDRGRRECTTFDAGNIGACYCYDKLLNLLRGGVSTALNRLDSLKSSDCGEFYSNYSLASALTYVSVFATTIVNVLMRAFLKMLATHEARTSLDEYQGSIMSKIFLSNFATMAIIVLVAYGDAGSENSFLTSLHIFTGPYDDFTRPWYGNVGFYLMTTFILQSFSPLVYNLVRFFFLDPLLRLYHHDRIKKLKSHMIVMQHDLNMLEVGPVFDSTDHSAQLLTLLFFAMMYAPGLPLLMPLCCFAFVLYFRVDKLLLCRFYQKPPNIGDAAIRIVIMYLPFAAILRLAVGIWMLGNTVILKTVSNASTVAYFKFLKSAQSHSFGNAAINSKVFQGNTFPLFLLLIFITVCVFLLFVWKELPLEWMYRILESCFSSGAASKDILFTEKEAKTSEVVTAWELLRTNDPLRQQSSPFTGEFFRLVKHKDEIPDTCVQMFSYAYLTQLTEVELEEGYKMLDRGDFVVKVKIWMQFDHKKIDGTRSKHGEHKKTYEVVADHRCYSYDIEKVAEYRVAMQAFREGVASMLDYLEQNRDKEVAQNAGKNILFEKAGLSSSLIADYEKRKKNRNVAVDDLFGEDLEAQPIEEDELENELLDKKSKEKPTPKHHASNSYHNSYVAIDNHHDDDDEKDKSPLPTEKSSQPTTNHTNSKTRSSGGGGGGGGNRNFTFDDFNIDDAMNQATELPPQVAPPTEEPNHHSDEKHGKHEKEHKHKKDKKDKKHKKDKH